MNEIENTIIKLIKKNGPISFADFMNIALYDEKNGYYSGGKAKIGKMGDFYTSPHVNSAFGKVIANFILKADQFMDNSDLTIIELGSGKGYLALDILSSINSSKNIPTNINYIIIEKNKYGLVNELNKFNDVINICNDIKDLDTIESAIIISNELFDSLPFHKIIYKDSKLQEYFIDYEDGKFVEFINNISKKDISNYLDRYKLNFADSKKMEVNLLAEQYLNNIANTINKGFLLTIDYGFLSDELFSNERMDGTYRCFHKHKINTNTYENIGNQDITADVDFSNLIIAGKKLNLEKIKYTTQAQFLIDWGILDIYEESLKSGNNDSNAIKNLFLPGMMGDYFKVLIQSKNINEGINVYPEPKLKMSFGIN